MPYGTSSSWKRHDCNDPVVAAQLRSIMGVNPLAVVSVFFSDWSDADRDLLRHRPNKRRRP